MDWLFDPRLWVGVIVGFALSESRPRRCPECNATLEPVTTVADLPAGATEATVMEIGNMLDLGYAIFKQKIGERVVIRAQTTSGEMVDLFKIAPATPPTTPPSPASTVIDV